MWPICENMGHCCFLPKEVTCFYLLDCFEQVSDNCDHKLNPSLGVHIIFVCVKLHSLLGTFMGYVVTVPPPQLLIRFSGPAVTSSRPRIMLLLLLPKPVFQVGFFCVPVFVWTSESVHQNGSHHFEFAGLKNIYSL